MAPRSRRCGEPGYAGGDDFWTERHAGFACSRTCGRCSSPTTQPREFARSPDDGGQRRTSRSRLLPSGYTEPDARCFAHTATAHGEDYGYVGCSPWMSAILADALDALRAPARWHAPPRSRASLVRLGRMHRARRPRRGGRPYYWMGAGRRRTIARRLRGALGRVRRTSRAGVGPSGRTDAALRTAADALVTGFGSDGEVGHVRSFNWQCRSAVAGAWFLQ